MADKHRYQPIPCKHCFEPIVWTKYHPDSSVMRGVMCGSNDTYLVTRPGWRKHELRRLVWGPTGNTVILLGTYDSFKLARTAAELHRHMTNSNCIVCKQPY